MKNSASSVPGYSNSIPYNELADYHRSIREKYKKIKPEEIQGGVDDMALMAFNGYYALENARGAFFAVDTNIHILNGSSTPIYDVSLLVSLNGEVSARFPFTGTFDGERLSQQSATSGGLDIDLLLIRSDGSDGTTAKCFGTIGLPGEIPANISGITYNNPIPYSLFMGEYYYTVPLHLQPGKTEAVIYKVLSIQDNYQILYDYGIDGGTLLLVPTYTYNLNMYFFSFSDDSKDIKFIMGSAAAGGLACNNIVVDAAAKPISRSLQTIANPVQDSMPFNANPIGQELAQYSGYYQIPSVGTNAFLSIQAEYSILGYAVIIAISIDGVTSNGYYFDESSMTFESNTLKMPAQNITITFEREYIPAQWSLVTITGSVLNYVNVTGYTLFNPVPIKAFGGVPMTNQNGDSLNIVSDSEVIYYNSITGITTTMNSDTILYVPIMYILANPWDFPTTVLSFGTNGTSGNAAIITDLEYDGNLKPHVIRITAVSAIN
jgi:hypothetical protein